MKIPSSGGGSGGTSIDNGIFSISAWLYLDIGMTVKSTDTISIAISHDYDPRKYFFIVSRVNLNSAKDAVEINMFVSSTGDFQLEVNAYITGYWK